MTLYNQAFNTYQAIHGEYPPHEPYFGASDTPFKGMPVETVSELCDSRDVATEVRAWKKKYPLKKPILESQHRFLSVKKRGQSMRNYRQNAIWIPTVRFFPHGIREGEWVYKEDSVDEAGYMSIIHIRNILNWMPVTSIGSELIKTIYTDETRPRIPHEGERDMFELLTSSHIPFSEIEENTADADTYHLKLSNYDKRRVTYSTKLHKVAENAVPKAVYKMAARNVPIWPVKVMHTSHGYPLIIALRCTALVADEDGRITLTWDREDDITDEKFADTKVWMDHVAIFPGEISKISDPVSLKDRHYKKFFGTGNI